MYRTVLQAVQNTDFPLFTFHHFSFQFQISSAIFFKFHTFRVSKGPQSFIFSFQLVLVPPGHKLSYEVQDHECINVEYMNLCAGRPR